MPANPRWADMPDSDKEEIDDRTTAPPCPSRRCADYSPSPSEEEIDDRTTAPPCSSCRPCWADMVDSDEDEAELSGSPVVDQKEDYDNVADEEQDTGYADSSMGRSGWVKTSASAGPTEEIDDRTTAPPCSSCRPCWADMFDSDDEPAKTASIGQSGQKKTQRKSKKQRKVERLRGGDYKEMEEVCPEAAEDRQGFDKERKDFLNSKLEVRQQIIEKAGNAEKLKQTLQTSANKKTGNGNPGQKKRKARDNERSRVLSYPLQVKEVLQELDSEEVEFMKEADELMRKLSNAVKGKKNVDCNSQLMEELHDLMKRQAQKQASENA